MANPFDDDRGTFLVVTNPEGQHSLWPAFAPLPPCWKAVFGPEKRSACTRYVTERWTDLRPARLVASTVSQ